MQIWNPHSKSFNKWAETFCSMSGNEGKRTSMKKLSLKTFFRTPTESPVSKSTLENFLTTNNTPQMFRPMSENDRKSLSKKKLSQKSFYWSLSENGDFTIPARNPCWVAVINYSMSKIERKNVFYQKNIFRQKFKWTSKMQFRQHRWKHIARSPRNFTSMCGKGTNFLQITFFALYAPIINRMQFRQTHGRVPASKPKKFNAGSEVIWKKIKSVEKNSPEIRYFGRRRRTTFDDPGDNFCQEAEKFSHKFQNWRKQFSFQFFGFNENVAMDS